MEYIKVMEDCNAMQDMFHNFNNIGLENVNYSVEDLATLTLEMKNRGYEIKYIIQFGEHGLEIRALKN